ALAICGERSIVVAHWVRTMAAKVGAAALHCESEMAERQSRGREINAASPGGKPDPATSDDAVKRTGLKARKAAGPDGPDATVVGDTFKRAPDSRTSRSKPPRAP